MSRRIRSIGPADYLLAFTFAFSYLGLLVATEPDLAMSRDESFYVIAAEDYGRWFELLAEDSSAAMEPAAIDRAWDYNHEHPALAKSAFALSWLLHEHFGIFARESLAHRFPGMLAAALLLALIYVFGARIFGRQAGAFAAASFALLPRVFYHAHLNCFDIPITLAITLTVYCYWRSLTRPRWAIATGIAFGLALATKHNSWVLPGIFAIHYGFVVINERAHRRQSPDGAPRISLVPWWLLAMIVIGPPLFVASWPWLWHDTLQRFGEYAAFHLRHDYYNMAYFGRNYFLPPFPVGFPFVMTAFTVPASILLLSVLALGERVRTLLPTPLAERVWPEGRLRADRRSTDVLLFGALFAPLVMIALPSTPIFGGTKHWFPAYPFLCLYAGHGFQRALRHITPVLDASHAVLKRSLNHPAALRVVLGGVLLAPAAIETHHSHPFGLSHYTFLAGGVPGAADHGMNRQFWGFTTGLVAEWLAEHLPDGGSVYVCDTTTMAIEMLHRDGDLPRTIRASSDLASADYVLVHHEHHFEEVAFQAWVAFGAVAPVHVLTYDGVPIVSIYENPRGRGARASGRSE